MCGACQHPLHPSGACTGRRWWGLRRCPCAPRSASETIQLPVMEGGETIRFTLSRPTKHGPGVITMDVVPKDSPPDSQPS